MRRRRVMIGRDGGDGRGTFDERTANPPAAERSHRPAGLCVGPGHMVVHGNPAFLADFGRGALGLPAREVMVGLPAEAFALLDAVLTGSRPLARWIRRDDEDWRLTAMPRLDPETQEVYGVAFHLRASSDVPVVRDA
jgi:hypothetical protein